MARRLFFWYLVLSFAFMSLTAQANAKFVASAESANVSDDLLQIRNVLEEKIVSQRLQDLGFTPQEVHERVASLSVDRIHSLALQVRQIKSGGVAEGVLIGLLIIILVIFVLLPAAGIRVWYAGRT